MKEVIFHQNIWIWFRELRIMFWGPEIKHLKAQLSVTRVFFLPLLSRNFDDQLRSNYHRFVTCAYVEIHQVRRLVFDNYQRCLVSLSLAFIMAFNSSNMECYTLTLWDWTYKIPAIPFIWKAFTAIACCLPRMLSLQMLSKSCRNAILPCMLQELLSTYQHAIRAQFHSAA